MLILIMIINEIKYQVKQELLQRGQPCNDV